MPKKVRRYRSKKTGRYISKTAYRRWYGTGKVVAARENFVKGKRRTAAEKEGLLRELLKQKKVTVIRKAYKSKKQRGWTHIELTYVGRRLVRVGISYHNRTEKFREITHAKTYDNFKDFERLRALINASSQV